MEQEKLISSKYQYNHNQTIWTKAIEISLLALVVLVPIVFYPYCITVFLPAKEMVAEVLIVLALMFWGLKMVDSEEFKLISTPLNFPILSFISICVLSLIWSNNFFVSLKELPLFLAGPLLYFMVTNNIHDERQISRILNVLLIIGVLFGIYGILQYKGIDYSFWTRNIGRQQVFGLFGNVNYFAEYLIVPLTIAVSLFLVSRNRIKRILLLIGVLAMGGSLIVTFTRGSYLAFGISLLFMFFLFLRSRGKSFIQDNKKIFMVILALIVVATFLFIIPTPLNKPGTAISQIKNRISISRLAQDSSWKRRIAIWKFTGMMIKDHPLLGSGIGTYKYNTLRYQAEFFAQGDNRSLYPHGFADKAHNEYLQLWAELGIVGLGIFIWLMFSYFSYGLKLLKKTKDEYRQGVIIGLMGAVVAVLVDGLFGFPLHLPATVILFWLALGLTGAVGLLEEGGNIAKAAPEIKIKVAGKNSDLGDKEDRRNNRCKEKVEEEKVEEGKKNKDKKDKKGKKFFRFKPLKPLLYLGIILLTIFLVLTVVRPFVARVYWYYADREIKKENWDEAIKINEKAMKWDPYLGEVYYNMGKILEQKEFYGVALQYFEKAAKYTDLPALPEDFALVCLEKGRLEEAARWLKQAILYQPDKKSMVPLSSELGNVYLQLKKYPEAEKAFKDALAINPDFVNAHYGLVGAYLNQNKREEALAELQKVIELAPDSIEAKHAQDIKQQIMQQIAQEKLKAPPTEINNP